MDKKQQTAQEQLTAQQLLEHPAQLWIGFEQDLFARAIRLLQQIFCAHGGCEACITCSQVAQQQHHAISWINPEKQYTLETIAPILHTLSFALEDEQHYFFILQKSDTMSFACANRLLKSLEEPPRGYHFILFSRIASALPLTIRSRCMIYQPHAAQARSAEHPLKLFFINPSVNQLNAFLSYLQTSTISEQESSELVDELLAHWVGVYKDCITHQTSTEHAEHMVNTMQHGLQFLPMPGSAKIFWKNLYLNSINF